MENGRRVEEPNDGGSTRVKGEDETRRRERMPMRLAFGDLPEAAGAEAGWTTVGLVVDVERDVSRRLGVMIGLDAGAKDRIALVNTNCDVLPGFTIKFPSVVLDFL